MHKSGLLIDCRRSLESVLVFPGGREYLSVANWPFVGEKNHGVRFGGGGTSFVL
jgi:hypothetical protein